MHKIIYRVVVKAGQEEAFRQLASGVLIPQALQMSGCQLFTLFCNIGNAREFIFYEQWAVHADVAAYKQKLLEILGPAHPGEEFPARLNDLIEADEDLV